MDPTKPYCFTASVWEDLFVKDQLLPDAPAGMVIDGYRMSFMDRSRFEDAYVRYEEKERELERN